MKHKIDHRWIIIGVPCITSAISLLFGYLSEPNNVVCLILGWAAVFLTVIFIHDEFHLKKFIDKIKQQRSYTVLQNKKDPVLQQVTHLVNSAQNGDEFFSTTTFPYYGEYEHALIDKVCSLAEGSETRPVFTRIIYNAEKMETKSWIAEIENSAHPIYGKLHAHIQSGKVRMFICPDPVGLDILMIANENGVKAIFGVKEAHPDRYEKGTGNRGRRTLGKTYFFDSDDVADSIYNYYNNFICKALEKNGNNMVLRQQEN